MLIIRGPIKPYIFWIKIILAIFLAKTKPHKTIFFALTNLTIDFDFLHDWLWIIKNINAESAVFTLSCLFIFLSCRSVHPPFYPVALYSPEHLFIALRMGQGHHYPTQLYMRYKFCSSVFVPVRIIWKRYNIPGWRVEGFVSAQRSHSADKKETLGPIQTRPTPLQKKGRYRPTPLQLKHRERDLLNSPTQRGTSQSLQHRVGPLTIWQRPLLTVILTNHVTTTDPRKDQHYLVQVVGCHPDQVLCCLKTPFHSGLVASLNTFSWSGWL